MISPVDVLVIALATFVMALILNALARPETKKRRRRRRR